MDEILVEIAVNDKIIESLQRMIEEYRTKNEHLKSKLNDSVIFGNIEVTESMSFGLQLRLYAKKYRVSQAELAEYLGVTQRTISRYMTDEVVPDRDTREKLLKYFDRLK